MTEMLKSAQEKQYTVDAFNIVDYSSMCGSSVRGKPKIAYDRIESIANRTGLLLILHVGTGLEENVFKKCISLGCGVDIHFGTIKHTFINSFVQYNQEHQEYKPLKPLEAKFE